MYPDDQTLIARGKYSTLGKDRRVQLDRVQSVCTSLMTATQGSLRDCETMPPVNNGHIQQIDKCLENLKDAREKLVTLSTEMIEIKKVAWPE